MITMHNIFLKVMVKGLMALLLLIGLLSYDLMGQERTRLRLNYQKDSKGDKNIAATLYSGRGRNMVYLEDALITLTAANNDTTITLARISTNADGIALLKVEKGYQFPLDDEGFTTIEATYEGNDEYRGASSDLEVKDLNFEIEFEEVDSVKTVMVKAYELDSAGNEVPVEGLLMYIGIQRLFSILPVGEVMRSEDGVYSLEFPDDIPGDSTGTYEVVARIEDNDFYGYVTQRDEVQWGIPVSYAVDPYPRRLWTEEAPLWMIISVFVVLIGAWYHFFLSIYKLNKIKNVPDLPGN